MTNRLKYSLIFETKFYSKPQPCHINDDKQKNTYINNDKNGKNSELFNNKQLKTIESQNLFHRDDTEYRKKFIFTNIVTKIRRKKKERKKCYIQKMYRQMITYFHNLEFKHNITAIKEYSR